MAWKDYNGRTELRKASLKRLADAYALLGEPLLPLKGRDLKRHQAACSVLRSGGNHAQGARYLGGYAVECRMKAIAMEVYGCWTLDELAKALGLDERDVYTHGLECLARYLPCFNRWRKSRDWRDFAKHVNQWRPSWRYDPNDVPESTAKAFLDAVRKTLNWLDANR